MRGEIRQIHQGKGSGSSQGPAPRRLAAIMAVVKEFPDVISVVDCVSSFTVVPIHKDALGIDVLLSGSQKALSLPPGLSLISVSEKARQRAAN